MGIDKTARIPNMKMDSTTWRPKRSFMGGQVFQYILTLRGERALKKTYLVKIYQKLIKSHFWPIFQKFAWHKTWSK